MNWTLIGLIVLAVAVIAAPLATLRATSYLKTRRNARRAAPAQDDDEDPDRPTGFW